MPVIVSATPAFVREAAAAGLSDMVCDTRADWDRTLDKYIGDSQARQEAGRRGRDYAERQFGEETLAGRWDDVLCSVMDQPPKSSEPLELSAIQV